MHVPRWSPQVLCLCTALPQLFLLMDAACDSLEHELLGSHGAAQCELWGAPLLPLLNHWIWQWIIVFLTSLAACIDKVRAFKLYFCPRVWKLIRTLCGFGVPVPGDQIDPLDFREPFPLNLVPSNFFLQFFNFTPSLDAVLTFLPLLQSVCNFSITIFPCCLSSLQPDQSVSK